MGMVKYLLLALSSLIVIAVSFIGKMVTIGMWEERIRRNLPLLASASAGVFSVMVWKNIDEALHTLSITQTAVAVGLGLLGIITLGVVWPESHHHHHDESHIHKNAWKILIADTLHNIVDGIALATAFYANIHLGIIMTISIVIHESVQELGEFFALRSYGLSTRNALVQNFFVACTLIIGVVLGLVLTSWGQWIEPWMLALSSGIFAAVVIIDIMPIRTTSAYFWHHHLLAYLCGFVILLGVTTLAPHHEHGDPQQIPDQISIKIPEAQ